MKEITITEFNKVTKSTLFIPFNEMNISVWIRNKKRTHTIIKTFSNK